MPRIVRFHEAGDADVLRVEDVPRGPVPSGCVRLEVDAFALNRADVLFRRDMYLESPSFPSRLGYDAVGRVAELGDGVEGVSVGQRVVTTPGHSQGEFGVYGEEAIVPATLLMPAPASLNDAEAAGIGVAYFTSYFALVEMARLTAGQAVLVTAASSSVGVTAIQIAGALGVRVIGTTRQAEKVDALKAEGADEVVVTRDAGWSERVRELTGGRGVAAAFDCVAGDTLRDVVASLDRGGMAILYGLLGGLTSTVGSVDLLRQGASVRGYTVFEFTGSPQAGRSPNASAMDRAIRFLTHHFEAGSIRPKVARVFPLEETAEAHRFMESNEQVGKIVVKAR